MVKFKQEKKDNIMNDNEIKNEYSEIVARMRILLLWQRMYDRAYKMMVHDGPQPIDTLQNLWLTQIIKCLI